MKVSTTSLVSTVVNFKVLVWTSGRERNDWVLLRFYGVILITCHNRLNELSPPFVEYTWHARRWDNVGRKIQNHTKLHFEVFFRLGWDILDLQFGRQVPTCQRSTEHSPYGYMSKDRGTTLLWNVGRVILICQSTRHYIIEDSNLHSHCCEKLRSRKINLSDRSQAWKMFCLTVKIYSDAPVLVQSLWAWLQWALCLTDCIMQFSQIFLHYVALCIYFYIVIHAYSGFPYPVWKSEHSSMWFSVNENFVTPVTGIWGFHDDDGVIMCGILSYWHRIVWQVS